MKHVSSFYGTFYTPFIFSGCIIQMSKANKFIKIIKKYISIITWFNFKCQWHVPIVIVNPHNKEHWNIK